jgi:hypothetical protein
MLLLLLLQGTLAAVCSLQACSWVKWHCLASASCTGHVLVLGFMHVG